MTLKTGSVSRFLENKQENNHAIHEQILGANAYISRANDRVGILRGYEMMRRTLQDAGYYLELPFDEVALLEFERQRHAISQECDHDVRKLAAYLKFVEAEMRTSGEFKFRNRTTKVSSDN
jgi:hypothetical protein